MTNEKKNDLDTRIRHWENKSRISTRFCELAQTSLSSFVTLKKNVNPKKIDFSPVFLSHPPI